MQQHHQRTALIGLCLSYFMVIIDVTTVNIALPSIKHEFGGAVSSLQWIIDGYVLSFAALLLLAGNLSDRLGAKKLFLVGLGLFILTSLACALSNTIFTLVFWRIVQGIGSAFIVPASLALIQHIFDDPA